MKKLLVGTVYAPSGANEQWRDLQRRYLDRTIGRNNYDTVVWLNRVSKELFDGTGAILHGNWNPDARSHPEDHLAGLHGILERFREARHRYDHFLIIDSDAFPFRDGWLEKLLAMMGPRAYPTRIDGAPRQGTLVERQVAAIIRTENLDVFFHPAAVFIKGSAFRTDTSCVEFRIDSLRNMMGVDFEDVVLASKVPVFPLLRTNFWNPHPLVAGVYGDIVYHHGAGSRPLQARCLQLGCYDHFIPAIAHQQLQAELFSALTADPDSFLRHLTGGSRFGAE